jgi:hypothetical protein
MFWRALLAASLLANVALLVTRDDATPAPARARGARGPTPNAIVPEFPDRDRSAAPREYQAIERAVLEQRLVAAEARLHDLGGLGTRFAGATHSPEVEARVKPYLDEVFARYQVAEPKYRFECRGRVCKVDSDVEDEWMMPLQQTWPVRALFSEMAFGPNGTFIQLTPDEQVPEAFLWGVEMAAITRARKPCGFASAPKGDIAFALDFDVGSRRITYAITGSLRAQPVGTCIAQALDEVIAAASPPAQMTRSAHYASREYQLPIDDDD